MKKPKIGSRIATRTVRIATLAIAISTAYLAATTLSSIAASTRGRRPGTVNHEPQLLPAPIHMGPGTWIVTGVPFSISTSVVLDGDLEATLSRRVEEKPVTQAASALERNLLDRVKQLAAWMEVDGGTQIYHLNTASIRARVFVAGDAPSIRLARIAYRRRPGEWTVVEAGRLQSGTVRTTGQCESLLPLPQSARTIGRRFDADGWLQSQLVSVAQSIDVLAQQWKQQGCQLRREIRNGQTTYVCQRKSIGVHVTEKYDRTHDSRLLFIVRTTSPTTNIERIDK